jgi:hypothetical protein
MAISARVARMSRELKLFTVASLMMGAAYSIYDSTFNNFVNERFALTGFQRSLLELPRELPGVLGGLCQRPVVVLVQPQARRVRAFAERSRGIADRIHPLLCVLTGKRRLPSLCTHGGGAGGGVETNQRDCVNINAEIFWKNLCSLPNIKGKVLMTTRLTPRAVEQRGELAGLRRLRSFTMPDCHAMCADMDQAKEEFVKRFELSRGTLEGFGLARDDYECQYCGDTFSTSDLTFDHVLPVAHGEVLDVDILPLVKNPEIDRAPFPFFEGLEDFFHHVDALGRMAVLDLAADDLVSGEARKYLEGTVAPQVVPSGVLVEDGSRDTVEELPDQVNLFQEGGPGLLFPGNVPGYGGDARDSCRPAP